VWKRIQLAAVEKGWAQPMVRWPKLKGGVVSEQLQGQNVPFDVLRGFMGFLPREPLDLYGVAMYTGWRDGTFLRCRAFVSGCGP
jgi:hypothetical protein